MKKILSFTLALILIAVSLLAFSSCNDKKTDELNFTYHSQTRFEEALKRPITKEDIEKQMLKTGDTPFYIKELNIPELPQNSFMAISKINRIRRNILDHATELLLDFKKPDHEEIKKSNRTVKRFVKEYKNYEDLPIRNENLKLSVFVDNLELIKAISNFPIHKFLFDPSFSFNSQAAAVTSQITRLQGLPAA